MLPDALHTAMGSVLGSPALTIPLRQRAKFEGWLKLELARELEEKAGLRTDLEWEYEVTNGVCRADLRVQIPETKGALVMLKTANTNWRVDGVVDRTRPITKNVAGIVEDVEKLKPCLKTGAGAFVCFAVFPVRGSEGVQGTEFDVYLCRIRQSGCTIVRNGFVPRGSGWGVAWYIGEVLPTLR